MGFITKEPVSFYGKLGYEYHFKAYDLETVFSSCEAVYIFTKRYIPEGKTNPCYKRLRVGETNNLATVIQEHINSSCLQKHGVDSICVRIDKDEIDNNEENRRRIVDDIIAHRTRPPCNKLWHDRAVVDALKNILKAYPYLEYDEDGSKHPSTDGADMLKVKIIDSSKIKVSVANQIAAELSKATGRKFMGTIPETRMNLFIGEGSKRTV